MTISINIDNLPSYPANLGPAAAKRLEAQRAKYRERADELRAELAAADEQWAIAFRHEDERENALDRVARLAKSAIRR